jgi:hypothetical protein
MPVSVLGKRREERGVAPAQLLFVAASPELLASELADRLEHDETVVADRLDQAVVDERGEVVELRTTDVLGCLQWKRTREDPEPGEEGAGARVEEVVAPLDRRTQRPLPLRRVAGTRRQEGESRVEPVEEPLGREQLRPRGGELDRERQVIEAAADLLNGRTRSDLATDFSGALGEEHRGLLSRKRLESVHLLARNAERRAARDEHASSGASSEDPAHDGRGVEDVLEVVEQDHELPPAEESREVVASPDGLGDFRGHELGIGEAREGYPEHAIAEPADELRRDLEREARLARAARARDGDKVRAVREHCHKLVQLPLAADHRRRAHRQVRELRSRPTNVS